MKSVPEMQIPETEIVIRSGDGAELLRATLGPGEYVIGRDSDCQLRVEADLISRRHAKLIVDYDRLMLEDLGSSNGTSVNGRPVSEPVRLWPNQKIKVGSASIELRRIKTLAPDASLAPSAAVRREILPEEFLREKRYEIDGLVAQGGMGAILGAKEATIERTVAMKVMLDGSSPDDLVRFVSEARVTGQLEHPNIVPVHELGVDENDQVFYTMKFVRGITLRKVLELLAENVAATVKKYPLGALLTIFQKVCDAIAFAHSKGVIHRDLKPENIMLGDYGEVLVMDWGLAKVLGRAEARSPSGHELIRALPAGTATMTGSIMGTPQYMAPEQARGEVEDLDARADIYSLGAILYHMLALRPSVVGDDAMTVVRRVAQGRVEPLDLKAKHPHLPGGRVPESLAAVVRKAMTLEADARYSDVRALQGDIEAYQEGFATSAEKAGPGKQLALFVRRHKIASAAAAIILVLTAGFMVKVIASERHAQQSLARLKETAPTFASNARALIDKSASEPATMEEALKNIRYAIDLDPEDSGYVLTQAAILLAQRRLAEARDVYAALLKREPGNAEAIAGATMCDRLQRVRMADGNLGTESLAQLASALRRQGRTGEALFVMRGLHGAGEEQIATLKAVLAKAGIDRVPMLRDDVLDLNLARVKNFYDLSPLRGMPLNRLVLTDTEVSDVTPLIGMPLTSLALDETRVSDLTPLRGMALNDLRIGALVKDISALEGMPLETLAIGSGLRNMSLGNFEVLRSMPLKEFSVRNTPFTDLRVLAGKKFASLSITNCPISDLSVMKELSVERLTMSTNQNLISNLDFLRGQKELRFLVASQNPALTDISALRDLPIESLLLTSTSFSAVEQLTALPQLKALLLSSTPVADLSALAHTKIQFLGLFDCANVESVKPLAQLASLRSLQLPIRARDVEALRGHPGLAWIGYRYEAPPAEIVDKHRGELPEFWKMHDLETQLRAAEPGRKLKPAKFPYMAARFPNAQSFNGHWYRFVAGKFTWAEAKLFAEDLGGHLASISSDAELAFALKLGRIGPGQVVWLGGVVDTPGGSWRWSHGEPWTGAPWAKIKGGKTEPDGVDSKNRPATIMTLASFSYLATPPDLSDAAADHADVAGFIVEWED